jgi:hypothetical protein
MTAVSPQTNLCGFLYSHKTNATINQSCNGFFYGICVYDTILLLRDCVFVKLCNFGFE